MLELVLLSAAWTVKETISLVVAFIISGAFVLFLLKEGKKEEPMIFEKGIIFTILITLFFFAFSRILY